MSQILRALEPVIVSVRPRITLVKDWFRVGTTESGVRFAYINPYFIQCFGDEALEDITGETSFLSHNLLETKSGADIVDDFGGDAKAEISLSEVKLLLERQGSGGRGVLDLVGWTIFFSRRCKDGKLRAICVCLRSDGWCVRAYDLVVKWYAGYQVFSRLLAGPLRPSVSEASRQTIPD